MKVKVESIWNGSHHGFRLTLPSGDRETIRGDSWNRTMASTALDVLEHCYGFRRRDIRFIVN